MYGVYVLYGNRSTFYGFLENHWVVYVVHGLCFQLFANGFLIRCTLVGKIFNKNFMSIYSLFLEMEHEPVNTDNAQCT